MHQIQPKKPRKEGEGLWQGKLNSVGMQLMQGKLMLRQERIERQPMPIEVFSSLRIQKSHNDAFLRAQHMTRMGELNSAEKQVYNLPQKGFESVPQIAERLISVMRVTHVELQSECLTGVPQFTRSLPRPIGW